MTIQFAETIEQTRTQPSASTHTRGEGNNESSTSSSYVRCRYLRREPETYDDDDDDDVLLCMNWSEASVQQGEVQCYCVI